MGLIIIVPTEQGADAAKAYAWELILMGSLKGVGFPHGRTPSAARDLVNTIVQPAPASMTLDQYFTNHPTIGYAERPAVERELKVRMEVVKKKAHKLFSYLPGEKRIAESFHLLSRPVGPANTFSVMYRRSTNKGQVILIAPGLTLDSGAKLQSASFVGQKFAHPLATAQAKPRVAMLSAVNPLPSIIDIASTIGQFVGFGIASTGNPIGGMVFAGGAALLEKIFTICNPNKVDLLDSIKGTFESTLFDSEIQQQLAIIDQTFTWLAGYNDSYLKGNLDPKNLPDKEWDKFYDQLTNNVLSPSQEFVSAVGKLVTDWGTGDPTYAQVALQPAILGCNLHLLLLKAALLGDMNVNVTYDSDYVGQLVQFSTSYYNSIKQTADSIDSILSSRMQAIGGIQHGVRTSGSSQSTVVICTGYSYVNDSQSDTNAFLGMGAEMMGVDPHTVLSADAEQSGWCIYCTDWDYTASDLTLQSQLATYRSSIEDQVRQKYYYEKGDDVATALATINTNLQKYQNWQSWSQNNPSAKPGSST